MTEELVYAALAVLIGAAKEHAQVAWERLAAMQHELNRLEAELDKEKEETDDDNERNA